MGGFLPVPGQAIYGASKAAVKIMTECLNSELCNTNIKVSIVYPGAIFTNIKANSGLEKKEGINAADYEKPPAGVLSPSKAAELIAQGVEQNRVQIYIGTDSKIMNFLYRLIPTFASNLINKKIQANHKM